MELSFHQNRGTGRVITPSLASSVPFQKSPVLAGG